MISRQRPLALAAGLLVVSAAHGARAADVQGTRRPTYEERRANAEAAWENRDFEYSIGVLMGFTKGWLYVDGQQADAPEPFFTAGLEQTLSYRVTKTTTGFALTLVNRLDGVNYDDRSLTHIDFAAGPELRVLQRVFRPTISWRFRVTGGYSLAFQGDREGRAVYESYSTGTGPNVGTAIVGALAGPRTGGYFQLSTFHRFLNVDATAELTSDPSVSATTRHEYTQHEFLFGGGVLVRF